MISSGFGASTLVIGSGGFRAIVFLKSCSNVKELDLQPCPAKATTILLHALSTEVYDVCDFDVIAAPFADHECACWSNP